MSSSILKFLRLLACSVIFLSFVANAFLSHQSPRLTLTVCTARKKKNKYANFSKADKLTKDPLDAMIDESKEKNKQLEKDLERKNNAKEEQVVDYDEVRTRNEIIFPDNREIDPYDPTTYGYIELGTILGAHGVKGEVKIAAITDFASRLCRPGLRHLKAPQRRSPRRIQLLEGRHRMQEEYLIRLEGVSDRDSANKMRGHVLYAREEERPEELEVDDYIVSDLVGLEVFMADGYKNEEGEDQGGNYVGIVSGIVLAEEMSAIPGLGQDLIEIILPRGPGATASWKDELVLIPLVPQIVPTVDIKKRAVYVSPPFGLLDLTYVREDKVRIKGFLPAASDD